MSNGALRHINRGAACVAAAVAGLALGACSGGSEEQVEGQTTGELAPNMAFLWLAHAFALVGAGPGGDPGAAAPRR